MPIESATPDQLADIQRLASSGRYAYVNFGHEDLAALLKEGIVVVGSDRRELWGLLCMQLESRPGTLPEDVPERIHLSGLVLIRGRSPILDVPALIETAIDRLLPTPDGHQIIVYANRDWIIRPLVEAQFTIVQRIQFLRLEKIYRYIQGPIPASEGEIISATPDHLAELARLDAESFEPIWHFSQRTLAGLLLTNRLRLAIQAGQIAGYAALALNDGDNAQLTRLAVSPKAQGKGIGRRLLADAIEYAKDAKVDTILLNTQSHNVRAQQLYRSFGFRSTGDAIPILTREIGPT